MWVSSFGVGGLNGRAGKMSVPVLSAWAQARKLPPTSRGRRAVQGVQRGKPRSGSKSLWDRPASKVTRDRQPAPCPEPTLVYRKKPWSLLLVTVFLKPDATGGVNEPRGTSRSSIAAFGHGASGLVLSGLAVSRVRPLVATASLIEPVPALSAA